MAKQSQANFESRENFNSSVNLCPNVDNVNSFKYLGIFISDFTWTNHVEYIAGKINQRLGLLNRIKYLLPLSARLFL